jgi:Ca2+/Na+ antiporter
MQNDVKTRPNVVFYLLGFVVAAAGIGLIVLGATGIATTVQRYESPLRGSGPSALADGAAAVFWGFFVITMGRILWRGARRRGAKDRFGRLLMIIAMVIMGYALQSLLAGAPELWRSTTEDQARSSLIAAYLPYVLLGIPAVVVGTIGGKLANEKDELISVSATANF